MNLLSEYLRAQRMTDEASKKANEVWYSEPEIRLAEALTERGLPFQQQVRVEENGRTRFVLDFLVAGVLGVEVDGREFHDAVKDTNRDLHMLRKHGVWTVRFSGWEVMRDVDSVVSRIALRLSELNWRPA
jgi:very-short-patch-repair endonuclease